MNSCGCSRAVALVLLLSALSSTTAINTDNAKIIWEDNFDNQAGMVSNERWNYELGDNGWGNQELQDYTNSLDNVKVENGNLIITANIQGNKATSGRITTQDKVTFQYGTLEAHIKMPPEMHGLWPAFWTLGNNYPVVGWPFCGELDVMEMGNRDAINRGEEKRWVGSAAHFEVGGQRRMNYDHFTTSYDLTDSWHKFTMDWTSTHVNTYVDGNLVFHYPLIPQVCGDCAEFHQPHFILLNIAMGGFFPGVQNVNDIRASMPASMFVDYVRIYANADSKPVGGSSMNGNIVIDCGCGSVCTNTGVLDAKFQGQSMRSRINNVMKNTRSEQQACRVVARQFEGLFGGTDCDPDSCKPPGFHTRVTCGCEGSCTEGVLNRVATDFAGSYTCGSRIQYLMMDLGKSEMDACGEIASLFPDVCGMGCTPGQCVGGIGSGSSQNQQRDEPNNDSQNNDSENIGTWIDGYNDGFDRAYDDGKSSDAKYPGTVIPPNRGSQDYINGYLHGYSSGFPVGFDAKGSLGMVPTTLTCGCPDTCKQDVLDLLMTSPDSGDVYSCRERIKWTIENKKRGEGQACLDIAEEFPECGNGCTPGHCAVKQEPVATDKITCGQPSTCTSGVLDSPASFKGTDYTCRARIDYLLKTKSEEDACRQVAREIPGVCGQGCDPDAPPPAPVTTSAIPKDQITCGCSGTCTSDVLDQPATYKGSTATCRDRIHYLSKTMPELDACRRVASEIPDVCGLGCNPNDGCVVAQAATTLSSGDITCGCPRTCSKKVLQQRVGDGSGVHSCEERIKWLMSTENLPEVLACEEVSNEFSTSCGYGCNPNDPCV